MSYQQIFIQFNNGNAFLHGKLLFQDSIDRIDNSKGYAVHTQLCFNTEEFYNNVLRSKKYADGLLLLKSSIKDHDWATHY
jgi:hypothetical protein